MDLPIFNIADAPGGIVDFDITEALVWALRNKSRDHIIFIPPGMTGGARPRWKISKTVEIPRQHGGSIWFGGQSSNNHVTGFHCEIEWTGPAHNLEEKEKNPALTPGSMFLYSSTDWSFYGSPRFYGNDKCGIGLLTMKNGSYNAGRMHWSEGTTWEGFTEAGIRIGKTVDEGSNETNRWGSQYFKRCGVGLKVIGHQALHQRFEGLGADSTTPIICDVYAAGFITSWITQCNSTLLRLNSANRAGGDSGKSTGKNNGYFRFSNVKNDTQADNMCLVQCRDSIRADVIIDGGLQSGGDTAKGRLLDLCGPVCVTLRNYRCLGGGTTIAGEKSGDRIPTVIFDGCRLFGGDSFTQWIDKEKSAVEVVQQNCLDYNGTPLKTPAYLTENQVVELIEKYTEKFLTREHISGLTILINF